LDRVSRKAKFDKKARFTCLFHLLDVARLRTAFEGLQRRPSPGVDGMNWQQYEVRLETRLQSCATSCTGQNTGPSPLDGFSFQNPMAGRDLSAWRHWKTKSSKAP
jgi:hypothetical protein